MEQAKAWHPTYRDGNKAVTIYETESVQCPVSVIDPQSEFVALFDLQAHAAASKESGACPFGADMARWPAWWFDVQATLNTERAKVEAAWREELTHGRN